MGLCGSTLSKSELAELKYNREIERAQRKANEADVSRIKLLLLGAGESGKSTIFKQMKILYGTGGFSQSELQKAALTIFSNIITDMQTLIVNCEKYGPLDASLKEAASYLSLLPYEVPTANIDAKASKYISSLWKDPELQKTWKARSNFQVQDSLAHYCENIERIGAPKYVPTQRDVLLTRVRTSGIVEEAYRIDGVDFVMFDVGGQRNERRKWIHCFEDVTAVIFVAAINEYDQVLYEDNKVNRIDEAVELFDEICNSEWFEKTSMILFLNKKDLFQEKLLQSPFSIKEGPNIRFPDFKGPLVVPGTPSAKIENPEYQECFNAAAAYMLQLFVSKKKSGKKIYHHITTATDTSNVSTVFDACKDIILKENLILGGFFDSKEEI